MAITKKETKQICDAQKIIWDERKKAGWTLRQRAGLDPAPLNKCPKCDKLAVLTRCAWLKIYICPECAKEAQK